MTINYDSSPKAATSFSDAYNRLKHHSRGHKSQECNKSATTLNYANQNKDQKPLAKFQEWITKNHSLKTYSTSFISNPLRYRLPLTCADGRSVL